MTHLSKRKPFVTGACAGALLGGVLALALHASPMNGPARATVVLSLLNCAAAGSLVARCAAR